MKGSSPNGRQVHQRPLGQIFLVILVTFCICLSSAASAEPDVLQPSSRDKCPVCGMFVAKYPDWTAVMLFRDKSRVFFDGAKDMFKYYLDSRRYGRSRNTSDVVGIRVTDYYSLTPTDGREAFYVVGSDVYGPMGREPVPFKKRSDAEEFFKDHRGKRILRFNEVTQAFLKELDS
ncbi:MAG: NosL [Syntrophorhabdaceae bacterium PtaU1.Bin034]|jgi:nitrous oxide reductase accessory protein NosL|nr:MAG: NosL [Syntrophorhabdaceae bacterium PtaU1.Bin034]